MPFLLQLPMAYVRLADLHLSFKNSVTYNCAHL